MTAIYGLWRFDSGEVAESFKRMDRALSRYGSDGHDVWTADRALVMGRWLHRSLPEDTFAAPPDNGRRYVVVGDVRLTERDDLVCQLKLGDVAAGLSDAEIAALAIETWNEGAFDRIYGAFAIAAWDRQDRRLLLARDHLGLKPLFYHFSAKIFAFASMPAGLQALPEVPRGPDAESMKRFLALENLAPRRTHYEGILRVMPGHFAIVTPDALSETRYWNPVLSPLRLPRHQDYVAALSDHLDKAVAAALRGAEELVGAQLSSGFDSTAVVTSAARRLAAHGGKVVAYTAAPREGYERTLPGRIADESSLASATAAMHPNIEHVVLRSDRTPLANLRRTSSIHGMPVLNICNQTWYDAISDAAADRGITILLEAANGNATISETGFLALPELVRSGRLLSWSRIALGLMRRREAGPVKILWKSFNTLLPNGLYRWLMERRFGSAELTANTTGLKDEHLEAATAEAANEYPIPNAQERVLSGGWIRPSSNSQTDRQIMLASGDSGASYKGMLAEWNIDCRDPTADRRLVEFSLRVPVEHLIHGGKPRAMLREVLADRAPREVLDNRMRGYQAADWHEWLTRARDEAAEEVARIQEFGPSAEILDVERLTELIEKWPDAHSPAWGEYDAVLNYRCCLLRSISAASFMRQAAGLD